MKDTAGNENVSVSRLTTMALSYYLDEMRRKRLGEEVLQLAGATKVAEDVYEELEPQATEVMVRAIPAVVRIMWIQDLDLMDQASRLGQRRGIPGMDSLILEGLLRAGCSRIYTTDEDLLKYRTRGVKVIRIRPWGERGLGGRTADILRGAEDVHG